LKNNIDLKKNFKTELDYIPTNLETAAIYQPYLENGKSSTTEARSEKFMKMKKECRRFNDLLEPSIDLSQPNVTTIMQRPVDMGETKRYRRKNYDELEKRRIYECKYGGELASIEFSRIPRDI